MINLVNRDSSFFYIESPDFPITSATGIINQSLSDNVISFEIEGRTEELICAMDARKEIVPKNIELAVKKENFSIHFIRLNENSYLSTLRTKLTWGLDKRN